MDIITHPNEVVNVYQSIPDDITRILLSDGGKWTMHKANAQKVAGQLLKLKKYARAYRMQTCADTVSLYVCGSCGHKHITHANLCRDRMCPICGWRLSMKRFASMIQIVDGLRRLYPESVWQFVTLTVQNCEPSQFLHVLTEMQNAWHRIWTRRTTQAMPILGWAKSMEVTYNKQTHTLHPHYHVLLLWDKSPSDLQFKWLERTWIDAVRLHTVTQAQDSRLIYTIPSITEDIPDQADAVRNAVLETYKYSIKSSDMMQMPLGIFKVLDEALRGKRLVAFGGVVKEYARSINANLDTPDDDGDDASDIRQCSSCGSVKVVDIVGKWTGDGYLWRRDI